MIRPVIFSLLFVASVFQVVGQATSSYSERYRLQYHFSPERNWINDPCGTVYYDGLYHLMYQYNPMGSQWGNMSWGHAVSADLVHWEELPVALRPDALGAIFTGSTVIDKNNTAGFGENAMVAIFTHAGATQSQSLAYSTDKGITWKKYNGNPILPNQGVADFRDPQVFWYASTSRWIMTLAVKDRIQIFSSPDLKQWQHESDFGVDIGSHGGVWECPDFFPLVVEGTNETKWVMIVSINPGAPAGGSGMQYFIGDFDGKTFTVDQWLLDALSVSIPEGKVFEDFESGYSRWEVIGSAFGAEPANGTLPDQQPVQGYVGSQLVNSFLNGDDPKGKLISSHFAIESNYINFLIGGGNHPEYAEIRLVVDGVVVRRTTGANEERLRWSGWDVRNLKGKNAIIEIIDDVSGGWGHINIDHIMFSDSHAVDNTIETLWADFGPDFYAARTWDNMPESSSQRAWIGWLSNWAYAGNIPTEPWRGSMSLTRTLSLRKTGEQIVLVQQPVEALSTLKSTPISFENKSTTEANQFIKENQLAGKRLELDFVLKANDDGDAGIKIRSNGISATKVGYNSVTKKVYVDRSLSGVQPFGEGFKSIFETPSLQIKDSVRLQIYIDESSVEVFVNGGMHVITSMIFPSTGSEQLEFYQTDGETVISSLTFRKLQSIWPSLVTESFNDKKRKEFSVNVYPNPSNNGGWFVDSLVSITHCELYDVKGTKHVVRSERNSSSQMRISTSSQLAPGVYFLKIFNGERLVESKKLVVR